MSTAVVLRRMQNLAEPFGETGRAENFRKQQKSATRIFDFRDDQEGAAEFRVGGKLLSAGVEPGIDLGVDDAERRLQLGRVAFRVVHEKTGVDAEETREERARAMSQVRARAAFDLREVGLGLLLFSWPSRVPVGSLGDRGRARNLPRSEGNGVCCRESSKNPHIAICKYNITFRYFMSRTIFGAFSAGCREHWAPGRSDRWAQPAAPLQGTCYVTGEKVSRVCGGIGGRCLVAGIFCRGGCALGPGHGLRWSCGRCGV